jgi:hypothetical protein
MSGSRCCDAFMLRRAFDGRQGTYMQIMGMGWVCTLSYRGSHLVNRPCPFLRT